MQRGSWERVGDSIQQVLRSGNWKEHISRASGLCQDANDCTVMLQGLSEQGHGQTGDTGSKVPPSQDVN